jgi:hypothetical protein
MRTTHATFMFLTLSLQLVEAITHATAYDHAYVSAFIATYRSFTTPDMLLQKLLERFDPPKDMCSVSEAATLQFRVAVVLKYWVEHQIDDFDDALIKKLCTFAETKLEPFQPALASLLLREVEKQNGLRKNRRARFETPPIDFTAPKGMLTPTDLVMQMSSEELARQLTLIDHSIYCAIQPNELLGQSWSKPAREHHSPTVVALLTRLNKVKSLGPLPFIRRLISPRAIV